MSRVNLFLKHAFIEVWLPLIHAEYNLEMHLTQILYEYIVIIGLMENILIRWDVMSAAR